MPPYKNESTLRRGAACLSCRKRKLKCDGSRPVCHQCTKMNRAQTCKYDDTQQKSRTQLLKEQLSALERKLQELESKSQQRGTPLFTFDTESNDFFGDGFLSASPDMVPSSLASSSSPSPSHSRSTSQLYLPQNIPRPRSKSASSTSSSLRSSTHEDPCKKLSTGTRGYLLSVFMRHRHQCWFYGSMDRFLENNLNFGKEPHPALINSIFLLSCHFAQSPYYADLESAFFTQVQREIHSALDASDRLVDIVQASALLSIYLYNKNRVLEGYRHAFSAVRLAVGLGLHQILSSDINSMMSYYQPAPVIPLPAPADATELSDRILAFWQVFMVDRCWSASNGLPLALPDKEDSQSRILTPWPSSGSWTEDFGTSQPPLQALLEGSEPLSASELYIPALKAKAATFYELTSRIKNDPEDWSYHMADSALQRFSATMPNMALDRDYIVAQTLVYTSFIHLRKPGQLDRRACKAGHSIAALVAQLSDADFPCLDPIMAVCWSTTAEMFLDTISSTAHIPDLYGDISNITRPCNNSINTLLSALKVLAPTSPLAGELVLKVERLKAPTNMSHIQSATATFSQPATTTFSQPTFSQQAFQPSLLIPPV